MKLQFIILSLLLLTGTIFANMDTSQIASINYNEQPFKPNPSGALLRSLALPGWGQYYNREYIKGGLITAVEGYFIYSVIKYQINMNDYLNKRGQLDPDNTVYEEYKDKYNKEKSKRDSALWWFLGIKFLSIVDAYVDAHLFKFQDEVNTEVGLEIKPSNDTEFVCISLSF